MLADDIENVTKAQSLWSPQTLQVRGVVPDQLLLQMLVSWLGPLTAHPQKQRNAKSTPWGGDTLAAKAPVEGSKTKEALKAQRPPLKA